MFSSATGFSRTDGTELSRYLQGKEERVNPDGLTRSERRAYHVPWLWTDHTISAGARMRKGTAVACFVNRYRRLGAGF